MNLEQIKYNLIGKVTTVIELNGIVELYKDAGWWDNEWDSDFIYDMVAGSCCFMVVIYNNKIIGMARAVADNCSDAYIQDVVVLNEYQKNGIGGNLIKALISELKKKEIDWIGLIGEPGTQSFYEHLGFKPMKNYIPMKYDI